MRVSGLRLRKGYIRVELGDQAVRSGSRFRFRMRVKVFKGSKLEFKV